MVHLQSTKPSSLDALRDEIDKIDDTTLALIESRLALARKAARAKPKGACPLHPIREEKVLARLAARASRLPELTRIVLGETLFPIAAAGGMRLCVDDRICQPMRGAA